ncbi:hypothetical protein RSAG8_02404, partial [Rhizoctonia solani AG-8 WAC10335]
MPYSPPSSAFTAVDVPLFRRPTPGDHSASASAHQSARNHSRTSSATMLNFSTERGPGAHKPLRGLPRRAKPSPAPVVTDPPSTTTTTDASTPRSMAAFGPPTIPRTTRVRPKFRVGDDDSSESTSTSPKGSPSAENGPGSTGQWTSANTASKGLSIDTTAVYQEETPSKTVPFPLLSPEPVATEPPVRRAAILPLGSLAQFSSLFANGTRDDDMATPQPLSPVLPPAPSPVPALLSPRLHPVGSQKSSSMGGSGHGRSASMADVCFDQLRQSSPPASGTSTPIVRKSNGQPLKPSLKSSLSSPNIVSDNERSLPDRTLYCVVKYDAHNVGEWWDNNNGENYRVEFERPESNGLGLESGPSKIGTGDQSSAPRSFNPITYNTTPAPPMPTTKPRSYSTSVVAPPPPIKTPLSNGPLPHLLSLRLSNYVSPSSNVPKAPALPKPADKEEPRAIDSFSPPSSPEHVKRPLELPESDFGVDFQHDPREPGPLKMPATITPPDSAHNSPCPSPQMKRKPLLPPSALPQSTDNGLLSPSSSPSNSLLITSPRIDGQAEQSAEDAHKEQNSPSSPPCFLDEAYSELVSRVCFHHSSPGGTPPYGLGVTTSPKGGSPAGSGANSPLKANSRSGLPRGGSYMLGAPGTTPTFIK